LPEELYDRIQSLAAENSPDFELKL
jgi:hypothetical protein